MSARRNSTSVELIEAHNKLAADGLIEVVKLSGGRSQLALPQGDQDERVRTYLRKIRNRADNAG